MVQASIPLPASTVVLIRPDGGTSFEIYLNRRPDEMNTYAGVYVFPGGRVEKNDYSAAMLSLTRGLTPQEAQQKLGAEELQPEICLAHWVAAIRELFEESGIYFFVPLNGAGDSLAAPLAERLADKRAALQRGELNLPNLLRSEQLYCDATRLNYFFHRVTPEHYAVRFDTRFYLAALPPDQYPLHASEEVSESLWIAPAAALSRAETGDYRMMPPTLAVLRQLTRYRSWEELGHAFQLR